MSTSQEEARVLIYNEVYVPAFLEKCAEFGLTFNSADEVGLALENAALIKQANEIVAQTETTKTVPLLKQANDMLKCSLGLAEPKKQSDIRPEIQAALSSLIS